MRSHSPGYTCKLVGRSLRASLAVALAKDASVSRSCFSEHTILQSGQRRRSDTCLMSPCGGSEMQPNFCSTHLPRLSPTALSDIGAARIQKGERTRGRTPAQCGSVNLKTTAEGSLGPMLCAEPARAESTCGVPHGFRTLYLELEDLDRYQFEAHAARKLQRLAAHCAGNRRDRWRNKTALNSCNVPHKPRREQACDQHALQEHIALTQKARICRSVNGVCFICLHQSELVKRLWTYGLQHLAI